MTVKLAGQISEVRVWTSIFPPGGYRQEDFDISLMDEAMLMLGVEEERMVDCSGPDHCDPYITLSYETWDDAYNNAVEDSQRMRARAVELYENCAKRRALVNLYVEAIDELEKMHIEYQNNKVKTTKRDREDAKLVKEMERIDGLMVEIEPFEFGDHRTVQEIMELDLSSRI